MSNPIINIPPDPVIVAAAKLNHYGERIAEELAEKVTLAVQAVAPINHIFWSDPRVGTGGEALLNKLKDHIALLSTHYPNSMNPTLAGAGQYLTPQPDGSVVYAPPPPPPEEPEESGGPEELEPEGGE